jgi:hypothetical protein
MIHPKINEDEFLNIMLNAPVVAFQRLEYGYAVAAPLVAFYAPVNHPGGGNLSDSFVPALGLSMLGRMSNLHLRTLRPMVRPTPTTALMKYLISAFGGIDPAKAYAKADGSHPTVIDSECQIVIHAIEMHGRPDLEGAMDILTREALSDAVDLVLAHMEAVRELAEVGDYKPQQIKLNLQQASTAMKSAFELLLKP